MKWWMHWLSQLGMAHLPGGRRLHRLMQDRFGEHRHLESSTRFDNAELFLRKILRLTENVNDPHVVELGTGWIPAVPMTLLLAGVRVDTFDVTRHVDGCLYGRTRDVLAGRLDRLATAARLPESVIEERLRRVDDVADFATAAGQLDGRYAAPVDTTSLPYDELTADVVISNLVLQCIPKEVLEPVLRESFRILKPGGHAIHRLYLGDEYAGRDPNRNRLHYLAYTENTWQTWFCHRLKHLNRLRAPQFLAMFEEIGFEVRHTERSVDETSIDHLKQIGVDDQFGDFTWEEIATTSLEVTLRKPASVPIADDRSKSTPSTKLQAS